jgi:hypothetical protein
VDQVHDRPGQVAAPEDPLVQRLETALGASHLLVRGQPVLDEVQRGCRLQHPPELVQRGDDVGDRAHRPRRQGGVERVVGEGQPLAVEPGPPDRHLRAADPFGGQPPPDVGGLDRGDRGDDRRVVRDVEPAAEPDLHDLTREPGGDPLPERVSGLHPAGDVDDARQDVVRVDAHGDSFCRRLCPR